MMTLLLPLGLAFVTCFVLVPFVTRLANQVGLLDVPDGRRKTHTEPIPLSGGLAIFATLVLILLTLRFSSLEAAIWLRNWALPLPAFLWAAATLCAVGVVDDMVALRGRHKLAGQFLAVSILIFSGVEIQRIDLFGWSVELGVLSIPFTAFWLLGAINSLNLIDGMDGMVGCVGAVAALVISLMCFWSGHLAAALVAMTMVGAIVGFLWYNLPPARVYLGDCGSMLIGLVIGVLALESALKGPATVMLTIPVALLAIPIFDTTAALARRTLTGRSIYTTDRGHLHHCLQRSGLSRRRVLVLVSCLTLLCGMAALASVALQRQLLAAAAAMAVVGILVVTRLFGHAELLLLKNRVIAAFKRLRYGHRADATHEVCLQLQGSADWQELWQSFTEAAVQLHLSSICLDVDVPMLHEGYHARWDRLAAPAEDAHLWKFEIPLKFNGKSIGRLGISGVHDDVPLFEKVAVLGKIATDVEQAVSLLADMRGFRPMPNTVPFEQRIPTLEVGVLHSA